MNNAFSPTQREGRLHLVKSNRAFQRPGPPELSPALTKLHAGFFLMTSLLAAEPRQLVGNASDARIKDILEGLQCLSGNYRRG
jgi:hypothetical protein